MGICSEHWNMVSANAVTIWVQRGIFLRVRRAGEGEVCMACEYYRAVEAGGIERRAA